MIFNENDVWREKTELLNLRLSKLARAKALLKLEFYTKVLYNNIYKCSILKKRNWNQTENRFEMSNFRFRYYDSEPLRANLIKILLQVNIQLHIFLGSVPASIHDFVSL